MAEDQQVDEETFTREQAIKLLTECVAEYKKARLEATDFALKNACSHLEGAYERSIRIVERITSL